MDTHINSHVCRGANHSLRTGIFSMSSIYMSTASPLFMNKSLQKKVLGEETIGLL